MTTVIGQEGSISYGAYPTFYYNGLQIANSSTTPNTQLTIGSGATIDSTATFQMVNNGTITINAATNGLNGLDTGSLAASTVYAVFLVSDPVTLQPIGAMISKSYTQPLMPFSYSAFARIGFVTTDASSHFLLGYWTAGNTGSRLFIYDAPQATAITAGAATSYTNVNLTAFVPLFSQVPVWIASALTPSAASQTLKLQPGNATGDAITITSQVNAVVVTSNSLLMAQPVVISTVSSPVINYKVSNSGAAVAINVAGYQFEL
jgi:hypothetical protein